MPPSDSTFSFLRNKGLQLLTAALLLHSAAFYTLAKPEPLLTTRHLSELPQQMDSWGMVEETPIEPEVQEVLKADDTLSRVYANPSIAQQAGLFVAFFRSQQAGQAPHSPKNCLPGSGWEPTSSGTVKVNLKGRAEPIEVNRYTVARGENKAMVLYWYQSHGRVVASEYWSKIYLVTDSIRLRRSDTALVRVVVPVSGLTEERAEQVAFEFVRSSFPNLSAILPS
jgi:EpsI family protein